MAILQMEYETIDSSIREERGWSKGGKARSKPRKDEDRPVKLVIEYSYSRSSIWASRAEQE